MITQPQYQRQFSSKQSSLRLRAKEAYRVRVRSTDQNGFGVERAIIIQIGNSLEKPGLATDLVIPLYQYPTFTEATRTQLSGWWGAIASSADATQPITVVVNPSNGPIDPQSNTLAADYQVYIDAIRLLRGNPNVRIVGYIPTGYGNVSNAQFLQHLNWYSTGYKDAAGGSLLDGIFLDEVDGATSRLPYYRSLRDAVRANDQLAGRYIMANPGVLPADSTYYSEPLADSG